MKKIAIWALVLFGLQSCSDSNPVITKEVSPSGIPYTLAFMSGQEKVAIKAAWPTDWLFHDNHNLTAPGVGAQLILAGGADGYSPGKAVELFADLQAEASLYPDVDFVSGSLVVPKAHLDEAVKITRAHLVSPALDATWLDRIRNQVADNATQEKADPIALLKSTIIHALYGNQPISRLIGPDVPEQARLVSIDDIRAWKEEVFNRSNPIIVIAGDISAQQAGREIDALLEDLPAGNHTISKQINQNLQPRKILLQLPDMKDPQLVFVGPLPPINKGGEAEDAVATFILGGSEQSLLFKAIREDLRASYSFGSNVGGFIISQRVLSLGGGVDSANLEKAARKVNEVYEGFRSKGPNDTIDPIRAQIKNNFHSSIFTTSDSFAAMTLVGLMNGNTPDYALQFYNALDSVTPESIQTRLKSSFPKTDEFIVIATSPDATALPGACVIHTPAEASNCP